MRGLSRTSRDVPPFCVLDETHTVRGVNLVGLRRAGMSRERIGTIRSAFRVLFAGPTNLREAVRRVEAEGPLSEEVIYLLNFISASTRGVSTGPRRRGAAESEPPE
jgi:UDP-N-acetylglucosamine acyltransferase